MEANTTSLRKSAPEWSLAGDKQLLDILQNIHQSLVTRCTEVNKKLDEMVLALDGASVDLQNVNNKFMALSNSQFIESRVYDDDVDIAAQEKPKETPKPPTQTSELEKMKHTIRVLEKNHELIEILDSDTDDSDDDDVSRLVLKPKDMYSHRPLPYIIGSQAWKNKWHAGLHPEDSDSDSSVSKPESPEQYSDSEPEPEVTLTDTFHENSWGGSKTKESTGSSEVLSEQDATVGSLPSAGIKPSPSDIAAELARRLGGNLEKIPIPAPDQPSMAAKKVYRPDQPSVGTVFCDEPPPLDQYQSEEELQEEENDIFAELHKNKPYSYEKKEQSRVADDLFSGLGSQGDIFSDFRENKTSAPVANKSSLFEDESEPKTPDQKPTSKPEPKQDSLRPETEGFKMQGWEFGIEKPVGGISLFGNNKGAESIGAAILKRNQRKSSSDEDTISEETPRVPFKKEMPERSKEKDIFDDLFAKSEREQKIAEQKKSKDSPKSGNVKVDLFSDNLFDDIDDIFTTNVKTVTKKEHKNEKPLFDDDDDIFSDIAVTKDSKVDSKSSSDKNKSIFDSDDDLFAEKIVKKPEIDKLPTENIAKSGRVSSVTQAEDIFGNDEEDDIFSNRIENKVAKTNNNIAFVVAGDINSAIDVEKREIQNNNNKIIIEKPDLQPPNKEIEKIIDKQIAKSSTKSIFGTDEDDDELFAATIKKPGDQKSNISMINNLKDDVKSLKPPAKISLFDDDSDDNDLFGATTKDKTKYIQKVESSDKMQRENNESITSKKSTSVFDKVEPDGIFENTEKPPDIEKKYKIIQEPSEKHHNAGDKNDSKDRTEKSTKSHENSVFSADDDNEVSNLFSKVVIKPSVKQHKSALNETKPNVTAEKPNMQKPTKLSSESTEVIKTSEKSDQLDKDNAKVTDNEDLTTIKDNNENQNVSTTAEVPQKSLPKEEEIFTTNTEAISSKSDTNTNEIMSKSTDFLSNFEDESDSTPDKRKDTLSSNTQEPIFSTPNVFDDIFSEPPVFEKSAEPKRSKNVNALFDDDSDDEALFFKKNDPILDEKPTLNTDDKIDALFGIFHDEPPAIEIDFTQKSGVSKTNNEFLESSEDELFTPRASSIQEKAQDNIENKQKQYSTYINTAEDVIPRMQRSEEITSQSEKSVSGQAEIIEQKLKDQKSDTKPHKDVPDGSETKKVGKLKSMNFNINVNTLLPGASPKKKAAEQTDGQTISAKSHDDSHAIQKPEPIVAKSISFDGESGSQVLNNKISKERAKIQVKRRPSTRRARKEAARKSAIDFGEDSTDNTSSIDDLPKSNSQETRPIIIKREIQNDAETKLDSLDPIENITDGTKFDEVNKDVIDSSNEILQAQSPRLDIEQNIITTEESKYTENPSLPKDDDATEKDDFITDSNYNVKSSTSIDDVKAENKTDNVSEVKKTDRQNVTSKIVYILNDEDIFTNPNIEKPQRSDFLNNIDDDDDDLFKNLGTTSKNTSTISTLGNTYKDVESNANSETKSQDNSKRKSEISEVRSDSATLSFDDSSEPIKSKLESNSYTDTKNSKKVSIPTKISLLDDLSEDENDLFNKNKKLTKKVKSILDSDSDEDLFGGSNKKEKKKMLISAKETKPSKQTAKVESSLFGDEDDENLFGVKVKSNSVSSPQPTRSTREVVSKPSEPVFDDPLSLLGGEDD